MTAPLPPLTEIPQDLVSLSDYETRAKDHMSSDVYAYIYGGGGDEITLRRNREALDAILITPKILVDVTDGHTHTVIGQDTFRHPILLAPVAFQKLVHPSGELGTIEAVNLLETGMVVSTLATETLETMADQLETPKWFQLYFQQDRGFTLDIVKRAEKAGYTALVITIDAPLHGIRNRAQRAGFVLPDGMEAVNLVDRPPLPSKSLPPEHSVIFQGMMSETPTWADMKWIRSQTDLPIYLKGILSTEDALQAAEFKMDGIIVSNHGGRVLDCVPSAIEVLPEIREALGPDYPILIDGGIVRGTDVFKAIALGANAVLIGRPQLYALAVAGSLGVAHMLRLLREELEVTMALAGTPTLKDISKHAIIPLS
ncbi:MAG: alpha-hydroxy-acid oxidizing enzyme [Robiginitomaculum sp.]|nr:MAG: alpha-hydroxy-acid oxidizing enzyme [Robiginitomaculum sp.]